MGNIEAISGQDCDLCNSQDLASIVRVQFYTYNVTKQDDGSLKKD